MGMGNAIEYWGNVSYSGLRLSQSVSYVGIWGYYKTPDFSEAGGIPGQNGTCPVCDRW